MGFQLYRICHHAAIGFVVIVLSTFFAAGGIGENYTDNPFPNPIWLMPILVWLIGAILSFMKKTVKIGLVISFLPLLFYIVLFTIAYFI
ncbi:hypothetical protein P6709_06065 [Jeotgalibacillus sp. ET6]|uniref:hypothetical protein n=1 Tax=Jeotgalibacillus sp. ET6 TaxID=3037260 RepID=UPI0024187272|nr:hypothetical protein [Jeotgalibacillus sp. ET6]MDG5471305.1 hypothetical protein [Jeotgalibacillus sp. ET6]